MSANGAVDVLYSDPQVRARILEFLGAEHGCPATAEFITADGAEDCLRQPLDPECLERCLLENKEISRSLLDHESLLVHLDLEYVNFDFPGEVYLKPLRAFRMQEPVVNAAKDVFNECGITPLHVLSGRGHHFVWKIPLQSRGFEALRLIGIACEAGTPLHLVHPSEKLSTELTHAFTGLGMVMEFLSHRLKEAAAQHSPIPVEFTAIEVGPSECGRELVSIDISEYGDPLPTRTIRVPFSVYLKPWQQAAQIGSDIVRNLSPLYFIPVEEQSTAEALLVMRDPLLIRNLAAESSTLIPNCEAGMRHLIDGYFSSSLRRFHDWFYSHRPHGPDEWSQTYDQVDLSELPCCARMCITNPNDNLLRPSGVRLLTRVFMALGWHPRHIAGLIWSRFERDFGWGDRWLRYDAAMRADFYTRLYAGLFANWHDDLIDFNCASVKDAKSCPFTECPYNLDAFRQSALTRRRYGQLAHRPFNRLFSSSEHL